MGMLCEVIIRQWASLVPTYHAKTSKSAYIYHRNSLEHKEHISCFHYTTQLLYFEENASERYAGELALPW